VSAREGNALTRRRGPIGDPTATALFLGENSATADRDALRRAKDMQKRGESRERILQDTGWFEDRGRWNYETDDRQFGLQRELPANEDQSLQFFDHFPHPQAQTAYPKNSLTLSRGEGVSSSGASYSNGNVRIRDRIPVYGDEWWQDPRPGFTSRRATIGHRKSRPDYIDGMALHELQHAMDDRAGGWITPDEFKRFPDYYSMPTERRAYNVEHRRRMSPQERLATPPWATEEAAIEQVRNSTLDDYYLPTVEPFTDPITIKPGRRVR
jgi:hypothetical protein